MEEQNQEQPAAETTSPTTPPEAGDANKDERMMAMLAHLLGIITGFVGPLIIWAVKKDDSEFIADQAREALNFQLTVLIAVIAIMLVACATFGIGGVLMLPLGVFVLIFGIIAAMKANDGIRYRYPVTLRMIK